MAEPVRTRAIVAQLAGELRKISTATGWHTDLGADVRTKRDEVIVPTAARCTVLVTGKVRSSADGVSVEGVIELVLPTSVADAGDIVYDGADDIERMLNELNARMQAGDIAASGALLPAYAHTVFLDRPEGMPLVAAEVTWTSGYRR